jgi:hypothetical protein
VKGWLPMHSGSTNDVFCLRQLAKLLMFLQRIDDGGDDLLNGHELLSGGAASRTIPTSALNTLLGMRSMRSR